MGNHIKKAALGIALMAAASSAFALDQYASSVIDYSSQWSPGSWSAAQALGAPNTFGYGDIATAWAPSTQYGTLEFLTLGFDTPVYAWGATVRETSGSGFVYQIDVLDEFGGLHTVFSGVDPSPLGTSINAFFGWTTTSYLVSGLKIYVNTSHSGEWEEIDAVTLHGSLTPVAAVPEPGTYVMLLAGLGMLGFMARRRKQPAA